MYDFSLSLDDLRSLHPQSERQSSITAAPDNDVIGHRDVALCTSSNANSIDITQPNWINSFYVSLSMNRDTYIQWSLLWIEFHVPGHCKDKNKSEVITLRYVNTTVYIYK